MKEPKFQIPRIFMEISQYPMVFWRIIAMEFGVDISR